MIKNKVMIPLIVASVAMFVSLFFSSKIAAIGLAVWVITVGWTAYKTIFASITMNQMVEHNDKEAAEDLKNKKYLRFFVKSIALQMCVIGLFFVVINLIIMFNL